MIEVTLEEYRKFYAEEIGVVSDIRSAALIKAFAKIPREHFLGPGPWKIASPDSGVQGMARYRTTPDDDPRHLYHNVLISIDSDRNLNNGHPSTLATWLDALDIGAGERVFHLGCGLGYYSAIIAEVVGSTGHVTAIEVDHGLATRSEANLKPWANVDVVSGDGGTYDPGPVNAILVNAGVTHPRALWLERLEPGGRLLFPLTSEVAAGAGKGGMILVKRQGDAYSARFVSFAMIYSCSSLRDPELNGAILKMLSTLKMLAVKSLRRDTHQPDDSCLLHGGDFCLSSKELT